MQDMASKPHKLQLESLPSAFHVQAIHRRQLLLTDGQITSCCHTCLSEVHVLKAWSLMCGVCRDVKPLEAALEGRQEVEDITPLKEILGPSPPPPPPAPAMIHYHTLKQEGQLTTDRNATAWPTCPSQPLSPKGPVTSPKRKPPMRN